MAGRTTTAALAVTLVMVTVAGACTGHGRPRPTTTTTSSTTTTTSSTTTTTTLPAAGTPFDVVVSPCGHLHGYAAHEPDAVPAGGPFRIVLDRLSVPGSLVPVFYTVNVYFPLPPEVETITRVTAPGLLGWSVTNGRLALGWGKFVTLYNPNPPPVIVPGPGSIGVNPPDITSITVEGRLKPNVTGSAVEWPAPSLYEGVVSSATGAAYYADCPAEPASAPIDRIPVA